MKNTWFDIGYDRGLAHDEPDYPENSFARADYRMGFEAGNWAKTCTEQGWKVLPRERAKQMAGY